MMADLVAILIRTIEIYKLVLLARILLTWLPQINWYNQPFRFLRDATDPVMEPFRRLIPPIGMLDISPIVLFFVLGLLQSALAQLVNGF